MAKKNRKLIRSNETDTEFPIETSGESATLDVTSQGEEAATPHEQQEFPSPENESSTEDLLDDVRKALVEEEEIDKNKKESKWWRRIGRKEKPVEPEPSLGEIDLPPTSLQTGIAEGPSETTEPDKYDEQLNDLIDLLEAEYDVPDTELSSVGRDISQEEPLPEPEPEINFEQRKEQAFRSRSSEEAVQTDSDVRSIALDSGEEVFVEVDVQAPDPFEERLKAIENALRPYKSYLYMAFGFLSIVMAVMAALLIFKVYQRSQPQPVQQVSNLPYPVALSLPGGWSFNLGRGALQNGEWQPTGAEWLEGTEVCRWVSLPWSLQLEAVLRTLNSKDPIELVMSNNDKLTYGVYSVYEMTAKEIQAVDDNSPCLLVILSGSGSEKRWVLTALP